MDSVLAFLISMLFGVLFQIPKRTLLAAGITGAMGWLFYSILITSQPEIIATLLAAGLIGVLGELFARIYKTPVTVFVVVGFIPLVPGLRAYATILSFTEGNFSQGLQTGIETMFIASAIALGITIVSSISRIINRVR